jgi:hypothetical protein
MCAKFSVFDIIRPLVCIATTEKKKNYQISEYCTIRNIPENV